MDANLLTMSFIVFGILAITLGSGIWIGFSLFIVGMVGMEIFAVLPPGPNMASSIWGSVNKWELVALPLFIFMGEILFRSGISENLFKALVPWLNRFPSGLLLINIVACTLFAAVSGSSAATTATVGRITLSEFKKLGYDKRLSLGSLAGAGTLGFLIPPSLIMIIYAILAEVSIGKMFIAGILPGMLLAGVYVSYLVYRGVLNPNIAPHTGETYTWIDRMRSMRDVFPVFVLIIAVLGSIYTGIATVTEAAALGVLASAAFAFYNKRLNRSILMDCLLAAVKTTSMIIFIVIGAGFLSRAMGILGIPREITRVIGGLGLSPYVLVIMLALVYIILGCILDGFSIVVMTLPIALPLVTLAGFDAIWFGIFLILMVELSQITPPVGFNLFVIQGLTSESIGDIAKAAFPFFILMLLTTAIITVFPPIATYLPSVMLGK
ncbi:MAG: TRAP transporter large permease subunit [Proteobacteria bacterium]|nr:TRAP transporter large permease subunit [Pseudomonadota bacterium]